MTLRLSGNEGYLYKNEYTEKQMTQRSCLENVTNNGLQCRRQHYHIAHSALPCNTPSQKRDVEVTILYTKMRCQDLVIGPELV